MTVFKNVVVFKYMGPNYPSQFTRTANVVVCNFIHQLDTTATAEEILVGLVNLIKNAECDFPVADPEGVPRVPWNPPFKENHKMYLTQTVHSRQKSKLHV